ncbi:hypothetical protein Q3E60_09980 [Enterococcus faecium]|nr:hypothetical protein [Enterococcus faecium]MDQ8251884.1 hypothetical protein [Enterococcus faecium]MDQ8304023.1 hypothetical protein [Enterococcus faecium]MDQ8428071.1 hypothetical protein [Enterococcus faecium]
MSETIENIKKFNIGDRVTSTHSILLDRGFRGVTGVIKTIVLDGRTWQYLIELDDGRKLQCDDWHLEQPQLNDNQKIVLEWLEEYYAKSQWPFPFYVLKHAANDMPANIFGFYDDFTMKEEFEVLAAFAQWGLEQEE